VATGGPVDLVLGLDFGSGYSKAVIRDVEFGEAYAVHLGKQPTPYFVPTNPEGQPSIKLAYVEVILRGVSAPWDAPEGQTVRIRIGELIQSAQNWFEREHGRRYQGRTIVWHVHLGVPATMEDFQTSPTNIAFTRVLELAWSDIYSGNAEETRARNLLVYPELGAEITTYVQSTHYRADLHLLVDIGAGSVDIATFNLKNRECAVIMVSALSWSGVEVLERSEDDGAVLSAMQKDLFRVLCETKTRRYPKSPMWQQPFRTFWCGGGNVLSEYKELIARLDHWFKGNWLYWQRFDVRQPIKPKDLVAPGFQDSDYHRLSVAHGLSYQVEEMAEIRSGVPPVPLGQTKDYQSQFVDKDQI
jgi:hypothetical protein